MGVGPRWILDHQPLHPVLKLTNLWRKVGGFVGSNAGSDNGS